MFDPNANASPVNPLPPVLVALAVAIALVEATFQLGARGLIGGPEAVGWRVDAVQRMGFFDPVFEYMMQTRQFEPAGVWTFFSYLFVHAGTMHAVMAVVLLLALGNFASKLFSNAALLLTFFISGACGALAYGLLLDSRVALIGGYPGVYGFLGLYTWMLWVIGEQLGQNRWAAFRLVGLLVAIQVLFINIAGAGYEGLVSDVAGFLTGFLLATPLAPGGIARLRRKLQGR